MLRTLLFVSDIVCMHWIYFHRHNSCCHRRRDCATRTRIVFLIAQTNAPIKMLKSDRRSVQVVH